MTFIQKKLFAMRDEEYALFQSKLTPNIDPDLFIGVRVPACRSLAKELSVNAPKETAAFLSDLPHTFYEENMLHALLISRVKEFDLCTNALKAFLPHVNNWAVCDTLSPACFKKNKAKLLPLIEEWIHSGEEYTVRFGIDMLMTHYLDADFQPCFPEAVAAIRSDKYYVNMMIAWYFATALSKKWDSVIEFIERDALSPWVHNKAIQKARESYRITAAQKDYLATLKRKMSDGRTSENAMQRTMEAEPHLPRKAEEKKEKSLSTVPPVINLVRPEFKYAEQVMAMKAELEAVKDPDPFAGCAGLQDVDTFEEWVDFKRRLEEKYGEGYTGSEVFLAVRKTDDKLVGIIDYRHPLTDFLLHFAGNIGYTVRPGERKRGYGSAMLDMMLRICREFGESRVLVVCDRENEASRRTIKNCGGVMENEVPDTVGVCYSGTIQRYWIDL